MAYRIKLTPYAPEAIKRKGRNSFRVMVVASDAEDLPNEIFLHQRTLVDAATGRQQDEFVAVCSLFDLSVYPANEPDPAQTPAFFRKDTIDVIVPGLEIADDFVNDLADQVCHLLELMNTNDQLSAAAPIWCPAAPEEEPEESSSSSEVAP